jgi:hypothetical protein
MVKKCATYGIGIRIVFVLRNLRRKDMNCKRCNQVIPEERIEALPDTVLCVDCSQKIGSDFEYLVVEENLGNTVLSKLFVHRTKREIEPINEV